MIYISMDSPEFWYVWLNVSRYSNPVRSTNMWDARVGQIAWYIRRDVHVRESENKFTCCTLAYLDNLQGFWLYYGNSQPSNYQDDNMPQLWKGPLGKWASNKSVSEWFKLELKIKNVKIYGSKLILWSKFGHKNYEHADPSGRRSMEYICVQAVAGVVGSNPSRGMDVCLVQYLCCQVEVSATSRSLVQRSPTDCAVCLDVIKWKRMNNLDTCCE
jgi:hypothetical protein